MIKRNEGYAAIEKHMQEKKINLCSVQAKEVLGDVETLLGLRLNVVLFLFFGDKYCICNSIEDVQEQPQSQIIAYV